VTTLYYLSDFSDETMPCAPNLQAWADWLTAPEGFGRETPATDGETFAAYAMEVLGDIRVEWRNDAWEVVTPIPDSATGFYLRWEEGGSGWDVDHSGGTVNEAVCELEEDDGPLFLCCVRDLPRLTVRYSVTPEGPRCEVVGAVQ
jgi:hypothetical protein